MRPSLLLPEQNISKTHVGLNLCSLGISGLTSHVMDALKFIHSDGRYTQCSHETYGTVISTYKYAGHLEMYACLSRKRRSNSRYSCTRHLR